MKLFDIRGISRRLMAGALSLCMAMPLLGGTVVFDASADGNTAQATDGIVGDSRVADPDTTDDYQNRLLTAEDGSRYAGRVWTDKSVFAYGDSKGTSTHFNGTNTITLDMGTDGYVGSVGFNADFAHVFSALASSQVVNEYPPSPIDMVLVLDVSSSMGDDTEPAEGSVWAEIYKELEVYFTKDGKSSLEGDFTEYYKENHYLKFELLTEADDGSKGSKEFKKSEFTAENDLFGDVEGKVSGDGKMSDKEAIKAFLEKYKPGGYIKRLPDNNWEYVAEKPGDGEYRTVIGVQISEDSKFWVDDGTAYGKEYTIAQAAAKQAFEHSRFLNLIYSANNVIEQLMNDNPENRVSVVIYDRRATVIMPLTHYEANKTPVSQLKPSDEDYVYDSKYLNDSKGGAIQIIHEQLKNLTFGYLCPYFDGHGSDTKHPSEPVDVSVARVVATPRDSEKAADGSKITTIDINNIRLAGTNTHAGLTAGMEQLANATETTLTAELSNGQMSTVPRIPALVVMTDGGSNTVASGPWYDPQWDVPVQRSDHKNEWSSVVVTQYLLTAAYMKSAVEKNYSAYMDLGKNQDLPVYTVGVDLRNDSDDWVPARLYPMMDPGRYFTAKEVVPKYVDNPSSATGQIPLAGDSGDGITSNEGIIGAAYDNIQEWLKTSNAAPTITRPTAITIM